MYDMHFCMHIQPLNLPFISLFFHCYHILPQVFPLHCWFIQRHTPSLKALIITFHEIFTTTFHPIVLLAALQFLKSAQANPHALFDSISRHAIHFKSIFFTHHINIPNATHFFPGLAINPDNTLVEFTNFGPT